MEIEEKILNKLKELEGFKKTHPNMLNIPHEVGQFLNLLIKSTKRKRGIEVGTSNGYSAIWLGEALKKNNGSLITVELNRKKAEMARKNLKDVGLEKTVEVKCGGAEKILPGLSKRFDFVFIDADKPRYVDWIKTLEPKIEKGGIVVGDNRDAYLQVKTYTEYLQSSEKYLAFRSQIRESRNDALEISWKVKS